MIQYNIENNYGNIAEKVNNYYLEQENLEQIIEKIPNIRDKIPLLLFSIKPLLSFIIHENRL